MEYQIRADKSWAHDRVHLLVIAKDENGNRVRMRPWIDLSFTEIENSAVVDVEPSASLRISDAQALMDDLWRCGLRPTEGAGQAGQLAAVSAHLKDMQELVDRFLPHVLHEQELVVESATPGVGYFGNVNDR